MKRALIALWAVLSLPACGFADEADRRAVLDQLQAKFSLCVAFYKFEESCRAGGETGRRLRAVERRATALAEAASLSAPDAALRLELALTAHHSLSGGCAGLPLLQNRHAAACEVLSSAPD